MRQPTDSKSPHRLTRPREAHLMPTDARPALVLTYDRWIKWRMLFLFGVSVTYLIRLIFFRDIALAEFDIASNRAHTLSAYVNWRIASATGVIGIYLYSYLRRWHFVTISWTIAGIATVSLVADYVTVYLLTSAQPPYWMRGVLALRIIVIACLLLNAVNARKLPPRPVA